ncbi:hypothetical protein LDL08_38620 [Nonomuraea glycinis]|uniref:Uncharacterized protein n=1 Tax=Nonomuraea glycinis TaxID=2047744 RepID=A0A917ZZT8_9ACTN|nr:hypothetical protein [Nonomuraea glycinis]MCA2182094.1 hypothetical protein [Nonomuraea glycinis]GGP02315.1 hypothetical protein GCM10012278_09060 [Nonomuraea glycinis]
MASESDIQRRIGGATVLFIGVGQEPEEASNLDLILTLEDGSRWSATVLTMAAINDIWERWEMSGECFNGRYFNCPDLLLVREAGIDSICEVLENILATGGPVGDLVRLEDDDEIV